MAKKKTPPGLAKKATPKTKAPKKPVVETPVINEVLTDYTPGQSVAKGQQVMWPPVPRKNFLQELKTALSESDIFESKKNQKKGTVPKENANWELVKKGTKPIPAPEPSLPVEPIPYGKGMEVIKGREYVTGYLTWEALMNQKKSSEPKENSRWKLVNDATPVEEQPPVVVPEKPETPEIPQEPEVPVDPPYIPPIEPQPEPEEPVEEPEVPAPVDPEPPKEEPQEPTEPEVPETPEPEIPEVPTPEEPEVPELPEPEIPEEPEPVEPPHGHEPTTPEVPPVVVPKPDPVHPGQRMVGNILPFCRFFANGVSSQDFAGLTDGDVNTPWFHTGSDRKPFTDKSEWYIIIPEELKAKALELNIADVNGNSNRPMPFDAYYKGNDGKLVEVKNLIPPFDGNVPQKWQKNAIPEERAWIHSIKITAAVNPTNRAVLAAYMSEMELIAEYTAYDEPIYERPIVRFEQTVGQNGHPYTTAEASGRGLTTPDKLDVVRSAVRYMRMYISTEDLNYNGKVTANPIHRGAWPLDDVIKWNTDNGIHTVICLRNKEKDPFYKVALRNLVARYGRNKNINPATLDIYTGTSYPANEIKIGLGYDVSFQCGNEQDGGWKSEDIFLDPFTMAAQQLDFANLIKSIDPTAIIVSNGFALTRPGYIDGMGYWYSIHNNGDWPFDVLLYHDYCSRNKNGQRTGNKSGVQPEATLYYENARNIRKCLDYWSRKSKSKKRVKFGVGETGYSVSQQNPEQAVTHVPGKDRYEVQRDWHARTKLESWAACHDFVYVYSLYNTVEYENSLKYGSGWANWDMSMGVAQRPRNGEGYKRLPATDHDAQMLKHLSGYYMSKESDRSGQVFEHVLSKENELDIITVNMITAEGKESDYTLKYDLTGVKSVTLIRPAIGVNNAEEEHVNIVNGKLTVRATESVLYIRINPNSFVKPEEAKEGGMYTLATRPEKAKEGTTITVTDLEEGETQVMRSGHWITPKELVLETDVNGDSDDLTAVVTALVLQKMGLIEIKGFAINTTDERGPRALDAFLRSRGSTNHKISVPKTPNVIPSVGPYYDNLIKLPHTATLQNCEDAVSMHRRIMTQSKYRVTIASVGFLTNLEELLKSGPDQYSNLSGIDLIKQKKPNLFVMGGKYPSGSEYNLNATAKVKAASKYVIENWPGTIIFSGHEVGWQVWTGGNLLDLPDSDPLKRAMMDHGDFKEGETPGNHSWDPMTVLLAAIGSTSETEVDLYAAGYSVVRGTNKIAANGSNVFEPNDSGNHYYTVRGLDKAGYAREINSFLIQGQEPEKVFIKEKP